MAYVLSPRAQEDIDEVWNFSVERWDEDQAEHYVRKLEDALTLLADNPRLGRPCDSVRPGYFKLAVGSHIIFFRLTKIGIDVARILHQSMDFDRHL